MLHAFIQRHELDIIFLQEVTDTSILNVTGYTAHSNIGTHQRGTAILARHDCPPTQINTLTTGRAMAALYNGIRLVNLYAPSGTAKRTEREHFYNTELTALLHTPHTALLIGGDFNCVLQPADTTGQYTTSRALSELIHGLQLTDAWQQDPQRPVFTHHSPSGASRIDRFYASHEVLRYKTGIEIVPAPYTDHEAVVLRLLLPARERGLRRGRWRTNPRLFTDTHILNRIRGEWERWKTSRRYYANEVMWWERCVKPHLQRMLRREEAERRADYKRMEQHLMECVYDILRCNAPPAERFRSLQRYKAKLVRLHATRNDTALLDIREDDHLEGEDTSIYQILRMRKRRAAREITSVTDQQGTTHTLPTAIADAFVTHMREKFQPINIDETAFDAMQNAIQPVDQATYTTVLEAPIADEEVSAALKAGARHKSPGIDGISLEFYTANYDTIRPDLLKLLNHMFQAKHVSSTQKHGIIVCLPKCPHPHTITDYRPISLLPTDYKILARVLARRLKFILADQLKTNQFCGVPGNSILDALAHIRDVVAHADTTGTPYVS
jgi:exonuclease III